jgi:hypothetical protein
MRLYRAISQAERDNFFAKGKTFRIAKNTLEAKQFFKSKAAVDLFVAESAKQNYDPSYCFILLIIVKDNCFQKLDFTEQQLDGFEALTIPEATLPAFNKCINFVNEYAV